MREKVIFEATSANYLNYNRGGLFLFVAHIGSAVTNLGVAFIDLYLCLFCKDGKRWEGKCVVHSHRGKQCGAICEDLYSGTFVELHKFCRF